MSKQKIIMNYFNTHCLYDQPFFCHFGKKGLEMHCHVDFYEFCFVTSGSYENIYCDNKTICDIGTLLFLAPGESHSFLPVKPNSAHYSFIIRRDYFEKFFKIHFPTYEKDLPINFVQKTSSVQLIYLSHIASKLSFSIAQQKHSLMELFLYNIIYTCLDTIPDIIASQTKVYAIDLFNQLNNFNMLDENISDLYKKYPLSKNSLIADFKELTGYTIVHYRNIKRMEYAAHLLEEADYSITDIVSILNLSSLGYFSKRFKEQYGMTPKKYQSIHTSHTTK